MAPKRTARASPATTTTTVVTDAQLKAMINQGVTIALAARDADRSMNRNCVLNNQLHCGKPNQVWHLMFLEESDKIEKYVSGLPDMIHGSVVASRPKTMQDAIEMATEMMDKKISTLAERQDKNKRKLDNNNQAQQQSPKRQNVAQAYAAGTGETKEYVGTLPLCSKCKFHHNGSCTAKKERIKPLRVRALVMTIGLDLPKQILNAQTRAQKPQNLKHEDVRVVHFGKHGKLNPRYVRPFQVLAKVGATAYKLELPQGLSKVHTTFHEVNKARGVLKEPRVNQEHDSNVNNTNNINTVSPTINVADIENNVVDKNIVYGCDDDPNMPNLEEIFYSDDDEGFDAKADMTNLNTHVTP
ncbi:hypothetical protein Tco_1401008 [Tanacetum coccineum]